MESEYFRDLNYTLTNEDSLLERSVLPDSCAHAWVVCGSGGRVIPLLKRGLRRLTVVDLSFPQLALCELRLALVRTLEHSDFLRFFAYPGVPGLSAKERESVFMDLELRPESRRYLEDRLRRSGFSSPLLEGRWERTFIGFSKLARVIMGSARIERLFACTGPSEQAELVRNEWSGLRWKTLIALAGNARTFNSLLYSGDFPTNNTGSGYVGYYHRAFDRLFAQGPARDNFFLQLTLLGELRFAGGLPPETDREIYLEAREALNGIELDWVEGDLVKGLERARGVEFVSFSNVASYFKPPVEQEFLQKIAPGLVPGARVVLRHYLHRPEGLGRGGFQDITPDFRGPIERERMQMYEVEVLERMPV
jgi:S-adenosylmethionine-diacylglycerol 3-amino-3-carboxypropyl transferase